MIHRSETKKQIYKDIHIDGKEILFSIQAITLHIQEQVKIPEASMANYSSCEPKLGPLHFIQNRINSIKA